MAIAGENIFNDEFAFNSIFFSGVFMPGMFAQSDNFLVQEDGSLILLEDGSGAVLWE